MAALSRIPWLAALATVACSPGAGPARVAPSVEAPLHLEGRAYDLAADPALPSTPPQDLPGLHNVYRLSGNIVSGSEPHGEEAFEQLAAMGIRTILSVDGKVPDAAEAAEHGLRYVHIPIQYKGIAEDELLAITKTFRELPAPFYVHCFHGKHRGPAAAAVGRVALDGVSRHEAIAEMRQWCGTAPEYEGLYAAIATAPIPDVETTAASSFDFAAVRVLHGVRATMVPVPRAHDALKDMASRGWAVDPEHPDIDAVNEAVILNGLFAGLCALPETRGRPSDFQGWAEEARAASQALVEALRGARAGLAPDEPAAGPGKALADETLKRIHASCKSCHAVYRDT